MDHAFLAPLALPFMSVSFSRISHLPPHQVNACLPKGGPHVTIELVIDLHAETSQTWQSRLLEFRKSFRNSHCLHFPAQRIGQVHNLDRSGQEVYEAMDFLLGTAVFQNLKFQVQGIWPIGLRGVELWHRRVLDEPSSVVRRAFIAV